MDWDAYWAGADRYPLGCRCEHVVIPARGSYVGERWEPDCATEHHHLRVADDCPLHGMADAEDQEDASEPRALHGLDFLLLCFVHMFAMRVWGPSWLLERCYRKWHTGSWRGHYIDPQEET